MNKNSDVILIGAGLIGLSTAYKLLLKNPGLKVRVLEKEQGPAHHQSGRNSGVLHSGIYYAPGSLKAKNCLAGYGQMCAFADEFRIPYKLCGKIILATQESELAHLRKIYENGLGNGLKIEMIDVQTIREIEPFATGIKGIHVPQAGIINYQDVARKLVERVESLGGEVCFNQHVSCIERVAPSMKVTTKHQAFEAGYLINCAGLYVDHVAKLTGMKIEMKILPFRGEYYKLTSEATMKINGLIYPVPNPDFPFLGVHLTPTIEGDCLAGPNAVLAFRREGYDWLKLSLSELSETLSYPGFRKLAGRHLGYGLKEMHRSLSKHEFTRSLQHLVPDLETTDLQPGKSGVRAQACNPDGSLIKDFMIKTAEKQTHVLNAPSPAATSCLSIADMIIRESFGG